jgi:thiamine pyrophosphate-dependent acetolactate synthase large subunit-like protein
MARPDREVWAIVGDGGFQMTQAELQTMVQENVKVNIAIINNGYLGMVRQWQQFFHDRRYSATPMSSPDYVKLADAHGLPGVAVTRRAGHGRRLEARARLRRRGGHGFPRRAGRHRSTRWCRRARRCTR